MHFILLPLDRMIPENAYDMMQDKFLYWWNVMLSCIGQICLARTRELSEMAERGNLEKKKVEWDRNQHSCMVIIRGMYYPPNFEKTTPSSWTNDEIGTKEKTTAEPRLKAGEK